LKEKWTITHSISGEVLGRSKFDKKKYADDKKKILDFIHKNGYRDARFLPIPISYTEKKDHMSSAFLSLKVLNIRFAMSCGKKYRCSKQTSLTSVSV